MATITQTKLVGFGYGNKANYNATAYANHIWFDPTNKQIILNGIEYIPKKLSELVNDKNFLTSITKSMVENVLTGNITSHTHNYLPLSGGTISTTGATTLNIKSGSSKMDSVLRFTDNDTSEIYEILLRRPSSNYGLQYRINDNYYNLLHSGNFNSYAATKDHTHSQYLPLTGGTLSGALTCNGDYINMNNDSGSRGYRGFFNQSGTANRASGSHIFMYGGGQALGSNSVSIGYQAFAGIRNQDADKGTYPYIAWQWMPTEKIHITINNQDTANGEFYGYEVLGGKMVQYELGGNTYTYENTSTTVRVLVCVKDDADTGLIFGGKSYMPFNTTKTLIQGKYILGRGESITAVNTVTVGDVNYYVLAIYTWSATVGYDYSTQVKVMCATKVNNSNYSGASSYASGSYSVASGNSSVASGNSSVASGNSSVASGLYSVASGLYSVASGLYSVASGESSVASGFSSVASGFSSVASGYASVASGNFSVVLARNGETQSSYQTIVGKFNAKVAGLFIIGNGTSETARSNAFVVDDSGNVTAKYFSGYANAIGGEGFKIYAENNNQINFGGTASDTTIVFGAASKDNRNVPTTYKFGADGTAILDGLARRLAYTSISENADINTYINEGVYSTIASSIIESLVNAPTNRLNGEMRLEVISSSSSTTYIIQKFWSRSAWSGWKLHIRTTSSDGWTAWKEIALTDSSISGNAATATALTSSAGSATQPIYFSNGKPIACSYTLAKSVPSNAVFTDTTYSVATASADGLMSSDMYKAQMVKSVGIKQGAEMMKPDGTITITDHRVYITQDKSNINGVYQQASGENGVKIPNATKDYDGSMSYTDKRKLDKMPPTMFGAQLVFYNNEILVDGIYGDYDLESGDATVYGYDTTQENNHYITMVAFNITNTDLQEKLRNGYVKFGYSSKDNATYQTMRLLQSNFDGSILFVEFIHANPIGNSNFWFDCIWEVYPF